MPDTWQHDLFHADGTPFDPAEIELRRASETSVLIEFVDDEAKGCLSLLVGSTSPDHRPADIMNWCQGYGDEGYVARPEAEIVRSGCTRIGMNPRLCEAGEQAGIEVWGRSGAGDRGDARRAGAEPVGSRLALVRPRTRKKPTM